MTKLTLSSHKSIQIWCKTVNFIVKLSAVTKLPPWLFLNTNFYISNYINNF